MAFLQGHNILIKSEKNITSITEGLRAQVHHTHYGFCSLSFFRCFTITSGGGSCNDAGLMVFSADNHRHTFSLLPSGKMLHIFDLFWRIEIQAFTTSSTHEEGRGRKSVFRGRWRETLKCYFKLGDRALPGKKMTGRGEKKLGHHYAWTPIWENTRFGSVALWRKTSRQETAWSLCLQPGSSPQASTHTSRAVKQQGWASLQPDENTYKLRFIKGYFPTHTHPFSMWLAEKSRGMLLSGLSYYRF